jgi:hypothetical protein
LDNSGLEAMHTLENMTQQQPYKVLAQHKGFELREYPAGIQIETTVGGDFVRAGNAGFGPLVRFISGNNKTRQSIAMTAPVIQESAGTNRHMVRFVLPEEMKPGDVPASVDPNVKVIEVPKHLAAAKRFSGSWNQDRFDLEGKKLVSELLSSGLETVGSLYFARFDPPWKPGFLKRNEVLIRVKG